MNEIRPFLMPARPVGALLYSAEIPPPPSVNALFFNRRAPKGGQKGRGKTDRYRAWIEHAGRMLMAQGPRPQLAAPVGMLIDLGDDSGATLDTDNAAKGVADLLVAHKIIPNDTPKVVRHSSVTWGPGRACRVHVVRWIE